MNAMKSGLGEMFGGMFGPVPKGDCRLGLNGLIAVNVNTGGAPRYKTYDVESGTLTNCSDFALEMDGSFFLLPTMSVRRGDIILSDGGPCCVIESGKTAIRVFSYQRGTIEEMVPEHHIFMGKSYCYAKIVSPLANMMKGKGGMNRAIRLMMLSRMFQGGEGEERGMGNPMMWMLLAGGEGGLLGDLFEGCMDEEEKEE